MSGNDEHKYGCQYRSDVYPRITGLHDRAWEVFQWYLSPMGRFFFLLKSTASRWLRKASFRYRAAVEILGMRLDMELHFRPDDNYEEAQR